jgi:hypothetical protein
VKRRRRTVTNKYLKLALTLILAALAMKFAIFAQSSATSSAASVSGAITVLDGNKHVLGTLLGLTPQQPGIQEPNSFVIFRNGYFIAVQFGGKIPVGFETGSQIFWTGPNCTGNAYLSSGGGDSLMSRRMVIFSRQTNSFYVASGTGENALATTLQQRGESIESGGPNGTSTCSNGSFGISGWLLTPFDAGQRLCWELAGDPLRLTGPVEFKQF